MKPSLRPARTSRSRHRRGIALIFVLGCLAIIVIAAISFASFMKVERLVAGQSLELARARQAAMSGLERAIDRLNRGSNSAEYVYDNNGLGGTNFWPRVDVYTRPGTDGRFRNFPSGAMGRDGSMTFLAMNQTGALPALHSPDLITSEVAASRRVTGAAIAVIANASGKIDLGVLKNVSGPGYARNVAGNLDVSQITSAPNQSDLAARKTNALDFYSIPEVRYFPPGADLDATTEPNFTFFEQACQQYVSPVSNKFTHAIYVGSQLPPALIASPAYKVNLADALVAAGVPASAVVATTLNLIDYLDNDVLPSGTPADFCGEPIPLLNELNLRATQTSTSSNIITKITLRAEFNFPFPRNSGMSTPATGANDHNYKLRVTNLTSPGGTVTYTPVDVPVDPASTYWSFSTPADEHKQVVVFNDVEINSPAGTSDVKVQLAFDLLDADAGNAVVDRVGIVGATIDFSNIVDGFNYSREVFDGRFNYAPDKWATLIPTGTLGAMNTTITSRPTIALVEYPYFVRNNPMESACELGHIGLGDRAWQSIALLTDPTLADAQKVHRVLDVFTVHLGADFDGRPVAAGQLTARGGRAGPLVRGLVNLNTDRSAVLQSAILNSVRNERYPGDTSSVSVIVTAGAQRVADNIRSCRNSLGGTRNSFVRKSEVGELFGGNTSPAWQFDAGAAYKAFDPGSAWTENQYESILRQFMDLCDVRGNTFVVLVRGYGVIDNNPFTAAHSTPSVPGTLSPNDILTSSVELVANVWRDPQTRRVQIRNLKWVDRDDDSIPNL